MNGDRTYQQLLCCSLFAALFCFLSCTKEFSYEGGPPLITPLPQTDPVAPPPFLPSCNQCNAALADSSWQLEVEGARLCGIAEKTVIDIDRRSFTFFGPSSCSVDSGFVISVYLAEPLNANKKNLPADRIAFYYYDRVKPSYILQKTSSDAFTFLLEEYNHQTGKAFGRFNGIATTDGGLKKEVRSGRFSIRFK